MMYLFAMICSIGSTHQILIWPTIKIKILSTHNAISSITSTALALVHGLSDMAEEDALCILMATVSIVFTWVVWFTHLLSIIERSERHRIYSLKYSTEFSNVCSSCGGLNILYELKAL